MYLQVAEVIFRFSLLIGDIGFRVESVGLMLYTLRFK